MMVIIDDCSEDEEVADTEGSRVEAPTRPEEKKRGQTRKEERDGKGRRLNFGSF